ncbi:MAG: patatin-like phospholipase family protein [Bacteroidales bacterium]|nr:patatin-like phospholipase family protein [Bacteroidales bacterium]
MAEEKYNTGLVLSGGGARGFAHLGILQALNEAEIYPDVLSGTSSGALAGVMYCDGYTPKEICKIMKTSSRLNYMRPTLPRDGLLQISGIKKILETNLRAKTFGELRIPLYVTATDLNNGKAVYFSEGDLLNAVIASASIPVLFKPVIINKIYYVDGGILDNLPIRPIENKCRLIIGSFVNPVGYEDIINGLTKIAERTFMLTMSKEVAEKSKKFDLFIAPLELKNYGILDPEKAEEVFKVGYKATKEKLKDPEILKLISSKLSDK